MNTLYAVVGFRVDSTRAIYYKRCKAMFEVYKAINTAFNKKDCQFISLRKVTT